MKNILSVLAASFALVSLAPTDALANPQHERMKRCNADAKTQSLKGDERKAFMSICLKGKHEAGTAAATQAAADAVPSAAQSAGLCGCAVGFHGNQCRNFFHHN